MRTKYYILTPLAALGVFLTGLPVVHGQKLQPMKPGGEPNGVVFHGYDLTQSTRHFNGKPSYRFSIEIKPPGKVPKVIHANLLTIDEKGNHVTECEWTSFSGSLLVKFRVAPDTVARSWCFITWEYGKGQGSGYSFHLKDYVNRKEDSKRTAPADAETLKSPEQR